MIRDLTKEERPREKMLQHGVASLCHAELLAIFIRTGIKGKSAITLGQELIDRYGSLARLAQTPLEELATVHGLGLAKAAQIIAASELGSRIAKENIQSTTLDEPSVIYQYFHPQMQHLNKEKLILVLLNTRLQFDAQLELSHGTLDSTTAHIRDVLAPVITRSAYAFIIIHNHPSGDPTPSAADTRFTHRLSQAAALMSIRFIDHLIIGRPVNGNAPYYSFASQGTLNV